MGRPFLLVKPAGKDYVNVKPGEIVCIITAIYIKDMFIYNYIFIYSKYKFSVDLY